MANILESVAQAGNLTKLLQVLEETQLTETLKTGDRYTVFAPTDEAFERLPQDISEALSDSTKLKRIIAHHIGFGDVREEDLLDAEEVMTMDGSAIAVDASSKPIKINNANVITPEILADNGVIHIIDEVLFPALVVSE